ncbi:hypothetical protein B0A80_18665 [Flavobacterium tructae]|uniref:hypothetical protein n=1 Tax=Flavobacterium tructae TaxID=1114873 RepID=UPI000B5B9505|nr:hypothetical protein [Flavobacterium tructae]OXB20653.1 hypothetical protein B0A80_18665 [Flavobacterium tructae]
MELIDIEFIPASEGSKAEIILEHYLNKFKTQANTLTDISFDCLPFLYAKEPHYNMKGVKVSKSYFDKSNREAIRINYTKIYEDFIYKGISYSKIFKGLRKEICYFNWCGQIAYTKCLQPYYFSLQPIFLGDGTETIKGFSSQKQRKILKEERYAADEWLNSQNPDLHTILHSKYGLLYQTYLQIGFKENLLLALETETDPSILTFFNNEVFGMESMTAKELIISILQ